MGSSRAPVTRKQTSGSSLIRGSISAAQKWTEADAAALTLNYINLNFQLQQFGKQRPLLDLKQHLQAVSHQKNKRCSFVFIMAFL